MVSVCLAASKIDGNGQRDFTNVSLKAGSALGSGWSLCIGMDWGTLLARPTQPKRYDRTIILTLWCGSLRTYTSLVVAEAGAAAGFFLPSLSLPPLARHDSRHKIESTRVASPHLRSSTAGSAVFLLWLSDRAFAFLCLAGGRLFGVLC